MSVDSPCIDICKLDDETRSFCTGCLRTRDEIKFWRDMSDGQKRWVIERIRRLAKVKPLWNEPSHIGCDGRSRNSPR